MSVFNSLKGTFQSVQHDIAAGLKSITSSRDSSSEISKFGRSQNVTPDAGAEILNKYQDVWKTLYDGLEENAQKAEALDVMIGSIYIHFDKQGEMVEQLHEETAHLPIILNKLQELTDVLANLGEEFAKVENALIQLENVCEEEDLAKEKATHDLALEKYRRKKLTELEKVKVQVAKEHTKRIQEYEKEHQLKLKDRQQVFREAFSQDVEFYRAHGRTDRIPSTGQQQLELEQVTLDEDWEVLDSFLSSSDATPSSEKLPAVESEASLLSDGVEIKSDEDIPEEDLAKLSETVIDTVLTGEVLEDSDTEKSNPIEDNNPSKNQKEHTATCNINQEDCTTSNIDKEDHMTTSNTDKHSEEDNSDKNTLVEEISSENKTNVT